VTYSLEIKLTLILFAREPMAQGRWCARVMSYAGPTWMQWGATVQKTAEETVIHHANVNATRGPRAHPTPALGTVQHRTHVRDGEQQVKHRSGL